MSWLDKTQENIFIVTGDGRMFTPLWKPTSASVEFNMAEFNFPEVEGTLWKRGTPKGRKFAGEFYFNGESNQDDAEIFRDSTRDRRAWKISHPIHGEIIVQPAGLDFGYADYNVTKITCTLLETITEDYPKPTIDAVDEVISAQNNSIRVFESQFSDITFDVSHLQLVETQATSIFNQGYPHIKLTIDATEYSNRFNKVKQDLLNATKTPLEIMESMNQLVTYVAEFKVTADVEIIGDFSIDSVKNRIDALVDQYESIKSGLGTISDRISKVIFGNTGSAIISTMALSAVTNTEEDYNSSNDVLAVMETILDNYRDFINTLDSLESLNGGSPDSFIPDADSMQALNNLINFTIANLYAIALNSKQERSILCETDTNWIILTHRFYGISADDSELNRLMKQNNAGLNEVLQVRKGRKVVYYV